MKLTEEQLKGFINDLNDYKSILDLLLLNNSAMCDVRNLVQQFENKTPYKYFIENLIICMDDLELIDKVIREKKYNCYKNE